MKTNYAKYLTFEPELVIQVPLWTEPKVPRPNSLEMVMSDWSIRNEVGDLSVTGRQQSSDVSWVDLVRIWSTRIIIIIIIIVDYVWYK